MISPVHDIGNGAGGRLRVDLGALAGNYARLRAEVAPGVGVGAAVKADAYGLGVARIAPVLHKAGCRSFFVATLDEALALRALLPPDATVFLLNGLSPGAAREVAEAGVIPVLNSLDQARDWAREAAARGRALPCAVQIDSGMSRFGMNEADLVALAPECGAFDIRLVMSHLACADTPGHPQNATQLAAFRRLRTMLPPAPTSLAASSGIFLGPDYHFDLVRPGYALYGGNPTPDVPNPMAPVVSLYLRLVQERRIAAGTSVGYGAHFVATRPSRIGTLAAGYADGLLRAAGGRAVAVLPDRPGIVLPVIGRISMDCLALDLTDLGETDLPPGTVFEFIGPHLPLDEAAARLDTIGYEVLTSLGHRYQRDYIESIA
ncbi:alanine racemase [Acidomonas methanolica]|uniref:alanine racemase n=1 Tax=Acidomonas methanolica TaxID=437 RepID=UPI00211A2CF2|nr:alanine racemase [Acidomonas methanolica]MCQ9154682.1 alanine racemase [Acidomonas methanolica]